MWHVDQLNRTNIFLRPYPQTETQHQGPQHNSRNAAEARNEGMLLCITCAINAASGKYGCYHIVGMSYSRFRNEKLILH